jgi:hypothetical protein
MKNYLVGLAVTMSLCLLAFAMSSQHPTTLIQPVFIEQVNLLPVS